MRKILAVFSVLLLVSLAFFYIFSSAKSAPSLKLEQSPDATGKDAEIPERNTYDIKLEYDGLNRIKAEMDLLYINNTGKTMSELYFHLYPNIFRDRNHLPFYKQDLDLVFPDGFSTGGIDILEAFQDGKSIRREVQNNDEALMLSLYKPVQPGESSRIRLAFTLTAPKANYRFGYRVFGGGAVTLSLGYWYPILAVYSSGGWKLDRHPAMGDPAFSDISDYTVSFTVPQGFTVAASGTLKTHTVKGEKAVFMYSAEKIRDFAAAVSNNYETAEDFVDGIKIISYFHHEDKKGGFMALDVAKHALAIYNRSFGKYPYPELRIAEANFYAGGMEFPTFIMMNTGKYREPPLSNTSFERSMAHEVAHQWWYGLVGNDSINEPWLDEGLTEFSTLYYFEKRYGDAGRESYFERQVNSSMNLIKENKKSMRDPVNSFRDNREYFAVVYVKGALFYEELKNTIGEEKMLDFLRTYLNTYKYKNVSLNEFIDLLKQRNYDGVNQDFFKKWF
ncbi:MAG: M1 family metallopeptidase [Tepidanaerobacteraceae bacterium]|nr:M1 family metallopeptidase [Tepidanaerobacteraceae bacterium]